VVGEVAGEPGVEDESELRVGTGIASMTATIWRVPGKEAVVDDVEYIEQRSYEQRARAERVSGLVYDGSAGRRASARFLLRPRKKSDGRPGARSGAHLRGKQEVREREEAQIGREGGVRACATVGSDAQRALASTGGT
jgi:hypothetical protein